MRLLRHQQRIENQVARRDFLIKELRAMWAEIEEDEGHDGKPMECPACKGISLVRGEIINGLQEYTCIDCGHFEY
jgi:transposase-like protein